MSINVQFILRMSNLTPHGDLIEDLKGQLTSGSSTSNWNCMACLCGTNANKHVH